MSFTLGEIIKDLFQPVTRDLNKLSPHEFGTFIQMLSSLATVLDARTSVNVKIGKLNLADVATSGDWVLVTRDHSPQWGHPQKLRCHCHCPLGCPRHVQSPPVGTLNPTLKQTLNKLFHNSSLTTEC